MSGGNFYPHQADIGKKPAYSRVMSALFLCGILLFSLPSIARPAADHAPVFVNGITQLFSVCENESAVSVNTQLAIGDSDAGQTETWTVNAAPLHGALSGFSTTATSTGGVILPSGLTYTPAAGYVGADTFTIAVSDGILAATTTVYVTVNSLPTLSSAITPAGICSGTVFNYIPSSATGGATFSWRRAFVPGISNATASGTGNPGETLVNTTYYDVAVDYAYTVSAHGCTTTENVTLTVHPTPRLSSALYDTICGGGTFNYTPTSATSGTAFAWSRAAVAGIAPATASSGTGNISETLTNTSGTAESTVYAFTLDANGCTSSRNVTVTVLPAPVGTSITTTSPSSLCAGTMYQNFGAGALPAPGITYTWGAVNATLYAVGSTTQYCIVNFPASGNALVTLQQGVGANCVINDTFKVTVGAEISATSNILYYDNQFIYPDNTVDAYQWGYDNVSTLDSTLIPGATFQSYVNGVPDFTDDYYWVMTTQNGCTQKTYYNGPLSVINTQSASAAGLQVYPNPAANTLNISVNIPQGNAVEVVLTDMPGRTIKTITTTGHSVQFDIATLPAGCYLVSCLQNGIKVANAKFIKN